MAPGAGLRSHVLGEQQTRTGKERSVAVPLRRNEHYEQGNGMGKDQKYALSTYTNADARGCPWLSKSFMSLPGVWPVSALYLGRT